MATGCSGESFRSAFIRAAVRPTSALIRRTSPKASSPTTRARMSAHASQAAVFPDAVLPGAGRAGVVWVAVVLTADRVAESWDIINDGQSTMVYDLSLIHISEPTRQAEISYAV